MTPKASESSAVSGMRNDCRISGLDVRRNGLHDFSIFIVVGIWVDTQVNNYCQKGKKMIEKEQHVAVRRKCALLLE